MQGILVLGLLLAGTYTDMRTREVPDWISYAGLAAGTGIAVMQESILFSLAGAGAGAVIGSLLYYTGQWGGGDAKLLAATGSLLGVQWGWQDMFTSFLINFIFVGALYGIVAMSYLGMRHFYKVRKARIKGATTIILIALGASIIMAVIALSAPQELRMMGLASALLIPSLAFFGLLANAIEKTVLVQNIPASKLTLGDWLAKPVKVGRKTIRQRKTGLNPKELALLQRSKKTVSVRSGIPFVPCFLVNYGVTLWTGNILLLVL